MSKYRKTNTRKSTPDEKKKYTAHKMALLDKAVLDADLTPFQFALFYYVVMKHLWKPGDPAYPGYGVLAEKFGASRSAIRDALDQLEARGYLTCVMRGHRGRGENRANVYELGPGPQSCRQRIYKPRKSDTYDESECATAALWEMNQSAPRRQQSAPRRQSECATASIRVRHDSTQLPGKNSLEGTPLKKHTWQKGVCEEGKDKQEKPAPDSRDNDAESAEYFHRLFAGCPSPDSSNANGRGHGNGHGPTSPVTDLDRAVATYLVGLANHPKRASEEDVIGIRQELAEILEKDPIDVVMAALNYHMTDVWPRKDAKYRSSPLGFLKYKTWEKDTPEPILTAAREDYRRRQEYQQSLDQEYQQSLDRQTPADLKPENWDEIAAQYIEEDDGCDDGADRALG